MRHSIEKISHVNLKSQEEAEQLRKEREDLERKKEDERLRKEKEELEKNKEKDKKPVKKNIKGEIEKELLKMRQTLPELQTGEEVLATWPDDGWYYKSIVKRKLNEYKYEIEDINKQIEVVSREDIISESDMADLRFEKFDTVVALHPNYNFSYAPGLVISVNNNLTLLIRFYDCTEELVAKEECYKIPSFKFENDVDKIVRLEKEWVGETVIARNNHTFVYELGKITAKIGISRRYEIEWLDKRKSVVNANQMFRKSNVLKQPINLNDYILAPNINVYLPGRVVGTKGDKLSVVFKDGSNNDNVDKGKSYWLSRDFFEDIVNFYGRRALSF